MLIVIIQKHPVINNKLYRDFEDFEDKPFDCLETTEDLLFVLTRRLSLE